MSSRTESPFAGAADRPIFIGASPRSGTTLLRTMLNSHPDVAIPRETRFLPELWELRMRHAGLSKSSARRALAEAIFDSDYTRARRLTKDRAAAIKRLTEAPGTFGSVLGTAYAIYAEDNGKRRWGDKRPMLARYLDAIFAMFPDAQFVNVVRDPRASVASMRKLEWFHGDVVPALDLWFRSVRAVGPWRKVLAPDQYLDVQYELLVSRPEEILGDIARFLLLDPSGLDAMLHYHEQVDEKVMRYHWRLQQPPTTEAIRSWESILDEAEVALIEQVAADEMRRFGYERQTDAKPPAKLVEAYRTHMHGINAERRLVARHELYRSLRYRDPVAALLTSGQQQGKSSAKPPFWRRHIGKPR